MGLLDVLSDPSFRSDVGGRLRDAANRGVFGGLLGAPVDAATGVVNAGLMAGGYLGSQMGLLSADQLPQPITNPVGGSEWIGQKLQDGGFVSPNRNPLAEFLASLAGPGAMVKGGQALSSLDAALPALAPSQGGYPSLARAVGAISPEGKARLLQDLQSGQGSGRYRLGDVTPKQAEGLDALFGRGTGSTDVYMTDDTYRHLVERRLQDQGFSPEDVTRFVEQAMMRRSRPDLNVAKSQQNPALLGSGLDPVTGRPYSARMPLRGVDDGYEVRSVIPEGLRLRNSKAP